MMGKKPPGVLVFLLVLLKVLGAAEADCSSTCSPSCECSYRRLTSVPQDLPTTITGLRLEGNQITTLSQSDFSRYRSLETLWLGNNHISTINSQTFYHLSNLVSLYLHLNRLTILRPDMFTGLENLQTLYLGGNEITGIQAGTFTAMTRLRYLYVHQNKLITLITDMFTGLGNLERLDLNENEITDIQAGTFNPTPQLRKLYLYNNYIQSIPSNLLANLLQLGELRLSDNNITMFLFEEISKIQTISRLYLDNNQMTTLPSTAYDVFSSISDVQIDNNPWQCDCRMVDFRLKMNGSYAFENQITCTQPDSLNGQKLVNISPGDLDNCESPPIVRFETISDNTLVLGNTLSLVCQASGIPTPEITVILPSGLNVTVGSVGRVTVEYGTVIVRNVTADDAGLYVCIAANFVGSTFATLSIDVISEEPTITRFEMVSSDLLIEGEIFILACEASGVPEPDITVILPSGLNVTVESVGRVTVWANGTIIVRNVTVEDSGLYVCIATNSVGVAFFVFSTDVFYPKSSPTISLTVFVGSVSGTFVGTLLIVSIIIFTIRRKRSSNQSPTQGNFSVVYNSNNPTPTVITNEQDLTGQTQPRPRPISPSSNVPRPPSSESELPYEDVDAPPRGADRIPDASSDVTNPLLDIRRASLESELSYEDMQPPSSNPRQAVGPPNSDNTPDVEPSLLPTPHTANAGRYENVSEHGYQPLMPDNGQDTSHRYQPLTNYDTQDET